MNQQTPSFVSHFDPYVYQTLQGITGTFVVVQTIRGSVSGKLKTVMPDHYCCRIRWFSFLYSYSTNYLGYPKRVKEEYDV